VYVCPGAIGHSRTSLVIFYPMWQSSIFPKISPEYLVVLFAKYWDEGKEEPLTGYSWNSIVLSIVELSQSVPMNGCTCEQSVRILYITRESNTICRQFVGNMDDQMVSPICDNGWARYSAIKAQDMTADSIRSHSRVGDSEPVLGFELVAISCSTASVCWHTSLVTPVFGVTEYQSVSIEYAPQQFRDVGVLAHVARGSRSEDRESAWAYGTAEAEEKRSADESKEARMVFMMEY
jgi:hypothetical protein